MLDRVQFDVLKQGSVDSGSWSERVLTIDTRTRTMTISRRGHPEVLLYHAVQPATVQEWPHFCREVIADTFHSREAKRTVCILGTTAAVPEGRRREAALVGIPLPFSSSSRSSRGSAATPSPSASPALSFQLAERSPLTPLDSPSTTAAAETTSPVEGCRREKFGCFDSWVLRFPSRISRDVAVQMLRSMSGVKFSGDPVSVTGNSHRHRQRHVMGVVVSA